MVIKEELDPDQEMNSDVPKASTSGTKRVRSTLNISKIEQNRRNKTLAVEQLLTIYKNPLLRTNFHLEKGGTWPVFLAEGYRYRLARVYNNGKCELRCAGSDGSCRGKAVIRPDEPFPYYLQATDQHCHPAYAKVQSGKPGRPSIKKKKSKSKSRAKKSKGKKKLET